MSLQQRTLDSGFRRNDEIGAIMENRKALPVSVVN